MERYFSTGQSPQRAVAPTEKEEQSSVARIIKIHKHIVWDHSRASQYVICGKQSSTVTDFLRLLLYSLVSIVAPMFHTHRHLHIAPTRRTKRTSLGSLKKAMLFR